MPRSSSNNRVNFDALVASEGGGALYDVLASACFASPELHTSALTLRCLSHAFQFATRPLIVDHLTDVNIQLASYHSSKLRLALHPKKHPNSTQNSASPSYQTVDAWSAAETSLVEGLAATANALEGLVGFDASAAMRKAVADFCHPPPVRQTGWLHLPAACTTHVASTVQAFACLVQPDVCQLHLGGRCGGPCDCQKSGTSFALVPHGKGLIVSADPVCVDCLSVLINPLSGTPVMPRNSPSPIVMPPNPLQSTGYDLATSLMTWAGVPQPYTRRALRIRIGEAEWVRHIERPHDRLLADAIEQPFRSVLLRMMVRQHESYKGDGVPTLEGLLGIDASTTACAVRDVCEATALAVRVNDSRMELLRQHATRQMLFFFNFKAAAYGVAEFASLDAIDERLPGMRGLMNAAIASVVATDADALRTAHVLNVPFLRPLATTFFRALTTWREAERALTHRVASKYAQSFVFGTWLGADRTHIFELSDAHQHADQSVDDVLLQTLTSTASLADGNDPDSTFSTRDVVLGLHVFDALDPMSLRVTPCTDVRAESLVRAYFGGTHINWWRLGEWSVHVGEEIVTGPVVLPWMSRDNDFFADVLRGLQANSATAAVMNDLALPDMSLVEDDDDASATAHTKTCRWFEVVVGRLLLDETTRAFGLELLTNETTSGNYLAVMNRHDHLDVDVVSSIAAVQLGGL